MSSDSTHGCGSACDGCSGGACASTPADEAPPEATLVPPMRVLAGGDLHVVRAPRAPSVSPDVHPVMEVETIRAEGGDIDLVVKIAGRTLVLMTGEGGIGTFLGADERRTRLTGHLSPALARAVRWLVTGEGLG